MYAILELGGKQYRVEKGLKLLVDYMKLAENENIELKNVTLFSKDGSVEIGTPYLNNVVIKAKVSNPLVKGDKLIVFKYKAKSNYRRKKGHRQLYTELEITDLQRL